MSFLQHRSCFQVTGDKSNIKRLINLPQNISESRLSVCKSDKDKLTCSIAQHPFCKAPRDITLSNTNHLSTLVTNIVKIFVKSRYMLRCLRFALYTCKLNCVKHFKDVCVQNTVTQYMYSIILTGTICSFHNWQEIVTNQRTESAKYKLVTTFVGP